MQSDLIKQWMKANGWTQDALADRLGFHRSSVSRALARDLAPGPFWASFSRAFPQAAAEMLLAARDEADG